MSERAADRASPPEPHRLPPDVVAQGVIGFRVGGRSFGIPIRLVREINQHLDITPVRMAPPFVRGLINLRGQVVTVLDLGPHFGLGRRTIGERSRLIILKTNVELGELRARVRTCDEGVGLLVDQVDDVLQPEVADLERPPPNLGGSGSECIAWACKLPQCTLSVLVPSAFLGLDDEPAVPLDGAT